VIHLINSGPPAWTRPAEPGATAKPHEALLEIGEDEAKRALAATT